MVVTFTVLFIVAMSLHETHKKRLREAARKKFAGRASYIASDYPVTAWKARKRHRGPTAAQLKIRRTKKRRVCVRETVTALQFEDRWSLLEIKAAVQKVSYHHRKDDRYEFDALYGESLALLRKATNEN